MAFLRQVATVAAIASSYTVTADKSSDKMKAIGMPIIFYLMFIAAVALTHKQFIMAHQASSMNPSLAWIFRGAVLCSALSLFLYLSAAWAYGLVSSLLTYFLACICSSTAMQQYAKYMLMILLGWFGILIAIPSALSEGIIGKLTKAQCDSWYSSYSDNMCKDGWITFLEFIAIVQIGLTFLSLLTVMAANLSAEGGDGSYQAMTSTGGTVVSGGGSAPPSQQPYHPPPDSYQKISD